MSYDEELRAHQEHLRIGGTREGRKYLDPAKLADEVPEPQPAPEDAQLTDTDFLRAEIELAERHHTGHGAVRDLVMLTHQRAGLDYSEPERVAVINQVALAMGRGRAEVSDEQILALSGRAAPPVVGTFGYADGDEVALSAGTTSETRARRAARGSGQDSANAVIARHPELAHLFKAGRTSGGRHPSRAGQPVTSKTRAHASDLEDSPSDKDQPAEGGDVHAKIDKYLRMREQEFGGEARHTGSHGSDSYPAKSPQRREAEEKRARARHGGAYSIPEIRPEGPARIEHGPSGAQAWPGDAFLTGLQSGRQVHNPDRH